MAHSHHMHREHQVSHRRVNHILKGEPSGSKQHQTGQAFSAVTSKSAAAGHDSKVAGGSAPKRFARGGKVKGHTTNIAIITPGAKSPAPPVTGGPPAGPVPMPGGPPPSPMGGPPGMPPPGMPPGMAPPMRARGGRIDGEATKSDIKAWGKRAKDNSYFRGGAASGVGREEKAEHQKRRK